MRNVEELWQILKVDEKNFIIGGAEIFSELLPYTEEIFLTEVDEKKIADVFFPQIDEEFKPICLKKFDDNIKFEFKKYLHI